MDLQSLSIANLASRWACSRSAIEDMIKDGRLVAMRLGPKTTRIPIAKILEYEQKCLNERHSRNDHIAIEMAEAEE